MVYAFQGNAYQIGQYYLSPLYVWQANAFQIGQYVEGGGGPAAYTLDGTPGVITLTGVAASLNVARLLTAAPGSITLTGAVASLDYTPAGGPTAYSLTADPGAVLFTGASASLDLARAGGAVQAGGRGHKPLRVRRKHYVEIDGEYYEVGSQREAEAILARLHAKELSKARRQAARRAPQERAGRTLAQIVPPVVTLVEPERAEPFTLALQEQVAAVNAAMAAIYDRINASAVEWIRAEEDEEDIAVLISMGIL